MPFTAGVFSIITVFVPGTTILSSAVNGDLSDIATGLSTCVLKDGTQTITANIPMSAHKFTALSAGTGAGDSVRYEQVGLLSGNNTWTGTQAFSNTVSHTAAVTMSLTTAGSIPLEIISTDAGASFGPILSIYRNSASPAANDLGGTLRFAFQDSAAAKVADGIALQAKLLDATSGSVDTTLQIYAKIADAATIVLGLGPGLQIGTSPTGGDLGIGTANAAVGHYSAGRFLSPISVGVANYTLVASVGSNALTIAIKGLDGNDPSATNPVVISFRGATNATGDSTDITLTAATSFVVSSGSTMGTSNNTAFRLWVVGFNDASTFRLGAVNTVSGVNVMALGDSILASSTAEGGAGGADSAQVIYTGSAVSSKAMRLLGYMDWSSGLGTAGTWSAGPTKIQLFGPGVRKPNDVVQVVRTDTGASATGTTVLPADNTTPQSGEGDQYLSQAITPTGAPNIIAVNAQLFTSHSVGGVAASALFQDATAGALKTAFNGYFAGGAVIQFNLYHKLLAAGTSATTMKIRSGSGTAGTTTLNGTGGSGLYNSTLNSYIEVLEIMT